jgi:hypothetical protein
MSFPGALTVIVMAAKHSTGAPRPSTAYVHEIHKLYPNIAPGILYESETERVTSMLTTLRNALIGLFVLGLASTALAQDPEAGDVAPVEESAEVGGDDLFDSGGGGSDKPISVGLLLGYGISLEDGGNPWGLGFGLRGGYNIDAIFLGARFVYYVGETEEIGPVELSTNVWELGIEGGYDLPAGPVIIRPGLGLGIASYSFEGVGIAGPSDTVETSETELYIALGASVLYDINEQFFVGGDMRLQLVFAEETVKAFIILANGGMRF